MDCIGIATGVKGKPSQLKDRLRRPPNELILCALGSASNTNGAIRTGSQSPLFNSITMVIIILRFGFCRSQGNKELEAGFEFVGDERVDFGRLAGGAQET